MYASRKNLEHGSMEYLHAKVCVDFLGNQQLPPEHVGVGGLTEIDALHCDLVAL